MIYIVRNNQVKIKSMLTHHYGKQNKNIRKMMISLRMKMTLTRMDKILMTILFIILS